MNDEKDVIVDPQIWRRNHLNLQEEISLAALGEFIGTFFFLYFGYAGNMMAIRQSPFPQVNGGFASTTDIWIAMSYGFSFLVNDWAFYRISGGLFNPAVTLGLWLSGQLPWLRAVFLVPAQILGSMCAAGLVDVMFPGSVAQANTILGNSTSIAKGLFLEMFFTAQLVFVVLMLAAEKSRDTFMAPIGIGLALFVILIPGVDVTGGSVNPVRSFGCAVAGTDFPGYHWIYWLGPAPGATLAAGFYRLVKRLHYEEANPGQDASNGDV
ncbi:aquaporin rerated other eukaryote [Fusarium longipes]|uniref:Aquaporin rerated other eukaryote n=1 Tax=Fusarium longipes TaxID=694270 RepID=A0A395T958_9HYPO|nr:aquaporin rerated other eukaryote [Fusarium longipes]